MESVLTLIFLVSVITEEVKPPLPQFRSTPSPPYDEPQTLKRGKIGQIKALQAF